MVWVWLQVTCMHIYGWQWDWQLMLYSFSIPEYRGDIYHCSWSQMAKYLACRYTTDISDDSVLQILVMIVSLQWMIINNTIHSCIITWHLLRNAVTNQDEYFGHIVYISFGGVIKLVIIVVSCHNECYVSVKCYNHVSKFYYKQLI